MSEFMERFGHLTVGESIELNKAAENSMGDPTIEDEVENWQEFRNLVNHGSLIAGSQISGNE